MSLDYEKFFVFVRESRARNRDFSATLVYLFCFAVHKDLNPVLLNHF